MQLHGEPTEINRFLIDYIFHLWLSSLFHSTIAYILPVHRGPSMDQGPVVPGIIKTDKKSQEFWSCVSRLPFHGPDNPSLLVSFLLMLVEIFLKGRSLLEGSW